MAAREAIATIVFFMKFILKDTGLDLLSCDITRKPDTQLRLKPVLSGKSRGNKHCFIPPGPTGYCGANISDGLMLKNRTALKFYFSET
jgi:hypothetical protein